MLIVYPTTNYDSFSSLADAEAIILANIQKAIILANIPMAQHASWDLLTDADKEVLLRHATIIIKSKISLPDTLEDDLKLACVYLANYSIGVEMTDTNGKGNIKSRDIVGLIKTEWFTARKDDSELPNIVVMLLRQYEVTSTSSFTFNRA